MKQLRYAITLIFLLLSPTFDRPVKAGFSRSFPPVLGRKSQLLRHNVAAFKSIKTFHVKNLMIAAALSGILACSSPTGNSPAGDREQRQAASDTVQQQGTDTLANHLLEGADSSFIGKKRAEGIDFYAVGQEPGWALNMNMEKIYSFNTMDGIVMNTPPVRGTTSADGRITTYKAQVEMGEIMITVIREECMDIMSGEKFPFRVNVSMKRWVDKDFRLYSGCGRFLK
jgi:uncharacterized membrane protein